MLILDLQNCKNSFPVNFLQLFQRIQNQHQIMHFRIQIEIVAKTFVLFIFSIC